MIFLVDMASVYAEAFFVSFGVKYLCHAKNILSCGRQNGRLAVCFGSLLRHILAFSAYFVFGIAFAHIYCVGR